jgi:hypothetical protein
MARRRVDGKHAHARDFGCSASAINWLDISKRLGPDPCRGDGPCFLELFVNRVPFEELFARSTAIKIEAEIIARLRVFGSEMEKQRGRAPM